MFAIFKRRFSHMPVMATEITQLLQPQDGKVFIDMTFGGGGHTRSLLSSNKSIKVIAVDRDPVAIQKAHELAAEVKLKSERLGIKQTVIPIHGKFSSVMREIHLSGVPYGSVNGVIFDLGASSMQYDNEARGFSISKSGPLDMRMDTTNSSDVTAEDVVNNLNERSLGKILQIFGEERRYSKIANAIVDARTLIGRLRSTQELGKVVASVAGSGTDSMGRFAHPATKTFQALRIFVNNELNELNYALYKIRDFLIPLAECEQEDGKDVISEPYGVAAVLTFHSLEDRIVKHHFLGNDPNEPAFKHLSQHDRIRTNTVDSIEQISNLNERKLWKPLLKHVKKPSEDEQLSNPRSRSAKLRAALRLR